MLDIETTHKLASFLEAKFSLKNTTEIPRPVHGPLQYWPQQRNADDILSVSEVETEAAENPHRPDDCQGSRPLSQMRWHLHPPLPFLLT